MQAHLEYLIFLSVNFFPFLIIISISILLSKVRFKDLGEANAGADTVYEFFILFV